MSPIALPSKTPVICGPTAGGKSDLAIDLALTLRTKFNIPAEIVTADAFQVYQGLDIGTAKPTLEEQRGIPHHLIDIVPAPGEVSRCQGVQVPRASAPAVPLDTTTPRHLGTFTLDTWLKLAQDTIASLRSRHILPIVVGGTHLYVKALLEGLFEGPEPDHALRAELAAMDPAARRAELERADPEAARRIHPNDARRTIRALEIFRLTGRPISAHQTQWDRDPEQTNAEESRRNGGRGEATEAMPNSAPSVPPHPPRSSPSSDYLLVILDWDTDALNRRINARVKHMLDRGLLEEVRTLIKRNGFTPQSAEALGYKQLIPLVQSSKQQGRWPPPPRELEDAVEKIKIETRRFAKNQRTWLRRLSTTPGAIKLSCPPAPTTSREAWTTQILAALGLPV